MQITKKEKSLKKAIQKGEWVFSVVKGHNPCNTHYPLLKIPHNCHEYIEAKRIDISNFEVKRHFSCEAFNYNISKMNENELYNLINKHKKNNNVYDILITKEGRQVVYIY